jgi:hypothetical protein
MAAEDPGGPLEALRVTEELVVGAGELVVDGNSNCATVDAF